MTQCMAKCGERAERRAAPEPARTPPGDRATYPSNGGLQ